MHRRKALNSTFPISTSRGRSGRLLPAPSPMPRPAAHKCGTKWEEPPGRTVAAAPHPLRQHHRASPKTVPGVLPDPWPLGQAPRAQTSARCRQIPAGPSQGRPPSLPLRPSPDRSVIAPTWGKPRLPLSAVLLNTLPCCLSCPLPSIGV